MSNRDPKARAVAPFPKRPDKDRRVRQAIKTARSLDILNLIQSRGQWDLKAIAAELEWSERTIRRDLEVLELVGVPYYKDEKGYYRVRADYNKFPALALTADEALGQVLATALTEAPGLDIGPGAKPTTRKLAASSQKILQDILEDARRLVEVIDLKLADHSKHREAVQTVQFALLHRRQVTGIYESPYEEKPLRLVVHPYRLCLVKQAWYVIGHIHGEAEAKTFRIARFKSLRATEAPSVVPEQFDLREHFGNAWSVFRGDTRYDIELLFEPEAAQVVTETIWHHTQQVKRVKGGRITLRFQVDGLDEILNWILSWSGKVTVVKPDILREKLVQKLNTAIHLNSRS